MQSRNLAARAYHVFVLSRIRELVDGGMKTETAVVEGSSPPRASSRAPPR